MSLESALISFEKAFQTTSQSRQNLVNQVAPPQFDAQALIAEKVSSDIIATSPGVFSVADLLNLRNRVNSSLSQAIQPSSIGANGFFDGVKNLTDLTFLFNPGVVFDFARPAANALGNSVSRAMAEASKLSTLVSAYNTFIQAADRGRIDAVTGTFLDQSNTSLGGIVGRMQALTSTFQTKGYIAEDERLSILGEIDLLTSSVTGDDDLFINLQRYISEITSQADVVRECYSDVVVKKSATESFVGNFVGGVNLNQFTQNSFTSATTTLEDLQGDLVAAVGSENKFNRVTLQSKVAQQLQSAKQMLSTLPGDVEAKVNADPAKPAYDTFTATLAGVPTTNLQSVIDATNNLVSQTQTLAVRDIRPAYNTTATNFLASVTAANVDLGSIQTATTSYSPAVTDIGNAIDNTITGSGLERLQSTLTSGSFFQYSGMVANVSTEAGNFASALAEEIAITPQDEGGKFIALNLARNTVVGVHLANQIAARLAKQEVPGAVSTLAKNEENVNKATALVRQFLA